MFSSCGFVFKLSSYISFNNLVASKTGHHATKDFNKVFVNDTFIKVMLFWCTQYFNDDIITMLCLTQLTEKLIEVFVKTIIIILIIIGLLVEFGLRVQASVRGVTCNSNLLFKPIYNIRVLCRIIFKRWVPFYEES